MKAPSGWFSDCYRKHPILKKHLTVVIDQNHIFALETESETPAAADHNRPVAFEVRAQGMQSPPGSVHVFRTAGVIEDCQLNAQRFGVPRLDSGW